MSCLSVFGKLGGKKTLMVFFLLPLAQSAWKLGGEDLRLMLEMPILNWLAGS